jgi:hypothetical protein
MAVMTSIAAAGMIAGAGMGVFTAVQANKEEKRARAEKIKQEQILEDQRNSRQKIYNPMAGLTNEAENIGVATQATKFAAEQADVALANTLDTIRATGAGASGATALAQAALQSKQGIAVEIQRQELTNKQNIAATQMKINEQKAQGAKWAWEEQEQRDIIELDRTQNLMDKAEAQEFAAQAQKMEAIGNVASSVVSGMGNIAMGMGTDAQVAGFNQYGADQYAAAAAANDAAGMKQWEDFNGVNAGNYGGMAAYGRVNRYFGGYGMFNQ